MSANRRKRQNSNDSRHYYDWLDHAGEDLVCAQLLVQDDFTYNSAAFHCQQTIEKSFKAYILLKSGRLVDGHNLTWLCRQATKHNQSYSQWLTPTAALNRAYIETRYPADNPTELEFTTVREYYNTAKELYTIICEEIDDIVFAERKQKKENQ